MIDFDVAEAIASGAKPSPQTIGNSSYLTLRVTGTGVAARPKHGEFVFRDPAIWLSVRMQRRCVGLPIVLDHPGTGILDATTFRETVVGIVVLTFTRGTELWAVGRFFDSDLAGDISRADGLFSFDTSPAVAFRPGETSTLPLDDGAKLLVEGEPSFLDHIALISTAAGTAGGVWSRGLPNTGIDQTKELEHA